MSPTSRATDSGAKRPLLLNYGRTAMALPEGDFRSFDILSAHPPVLPSSEETLLRQRIDQPIGCSPLRQILKPGESVAVAISDVTRYSATEKFLSPLLQETDAAGIPRKRVTLFVARGTHRALSVEELREVVGPEISSGVHVEQSDPDGETVSVGATSSGTPVLLCRSLMERDRIVLTGTISFHYFAGFGGGRKALVPGCAGRKTAEATHFRIFRTEGPGKHPLARPGILAGNPVHEDILEAVSMAPPSFLVNTLLTPEKKLFDAVAGHWRKAHEEGCERYAKVYRVRIARKYPLVIASAGGFPKDINFIQSHKAMDQAFAAIEPGGALILLAECPDGFGSTQFFPWFRFSDPAEMEKELRANYQIYGQTAHAAFVKASACRVILISSLRPESVERMGMTPAASLDEAVKKARRHLGELPMPLIIPDAGYVLPHPSG
ncbi:MAG TPA: nickel-dependent lactate racemase [Candidatus Limnocylindrales bacterium]|nr:nickel-dependent lactate racemase [Candidatus Limnocylindrales bacterium]